ncbi:MAG TPA: 50S ribosomal protein L24 [Membranihabitans sp.]|nr:50S ribosomal protein L24 [Membranihabitans sp.]
MKKRFAPKWKIKKGDRVRVLSGEYKGIESRVLEVLPQKGRVLVEDVNMVKKHQKPTNDKPGGIVEQPAPINISNVMLIDPKTGEASRVGRRVEDGKLVRYSKKSGETIK